jgi:hypothetical protein
MATDTKNKIGSLWAKQTKDGKRFLSGSIEIDGQKIKIVIWPNDYKYSEKSPDFKVYIDTYKNPREEQRDDEDDGPRRGGRREEPLWGGEAEEKDTTGPNKDDDDVPF